MEQLVLVLLIAVISLINWLIEQSGKMRERRRLEKQRAQVPDMPAPPMPDSRDFLPPVFEDVLSLPQAPPVVPQRSPEYVAPSLSNPPPASPKPRSGQARAHAKQVFPATLTPPIALLGTPQGLRQAIVAREILGPPRAHAPY